MALDPIVTITIASGVSALGGMLVGGFFVYHRVEGLIADTKAEIKRVDQESKDELRQVWAKFDTVMPITTCNERQRGCGLHFAVFKEGQDEVKALFKELRSDLRAELKLLRECISQATQGKC